MHQRPAGWSIPRALALHFAGDGTHLQRYARILEGAEINSSFHRTHAQAVYERWAASTPPEFRFAVKLPRAITHVQKLRRARPLLDRFLEESAGLGDKRGPILVQLPPSLPFDRRVAGRFFDLLRERYAGDVVCEPRHPDWFTASAETLLWRFRVARVAAEMGLDPSEVDEDEQPLEVADTLGLPPGADWHDIADRIRDRNDARVLALLPDHLR